MVRSDSGDGFLGTSNERGCAERAKCEGGRRLWLRCGHRAVAAPRRYARVVAGGRG